MDAFDSFEVLDSYIGLLAEWDIPDFYADAPINRFEEAKTKLNLKPVSGGKPTLVAARTTAGPVHQANDAKALAAQKDLLQDLNKITDFAALEAYLDGEFSDRLKSESREGRVKAFGNASPSVVIFTEPPSERDALQGQWGADEAGQLLKKALGFAGLLDQALVMPISPWRLAGGRMPDTHDIQIMRLLADHSLRLLAPKAVLLLGQASVAAVMNVEQSLSRLRGKASPLTLKSADMTIMSHISYGPAFLLRQPQAKAPFWADLLALAHSLIPSALQKV